MSVSITKACGVKVLTVVAEEGNPINCPLLCMLLCKLCPCSFGRGPSPKHRSQSVLGALQIMIGILNIGLGMLPINTFNDHYYLPSCVPWFGVLFIIVGIMTILSERFSFSCMAGLSVLLNVCGAAFAITTLVNYSMLMYNINDGSYSCKENPYSGWFWEGKTTPGNVEVTREICYEGQVLMYLLKRSIVCVLMILSVLELCVAFSSVVLTIKFQNKRTSDSDEPKTPALKKTNTDPTL